MKANFSQIQRSKSRLDHSVNKSNNTTLSTSRPSSSPFRPLTRSVKTIPRIVLPRFDYQLSEDSVSQSKPLNFCFVKAAELYDQRKFGFAVKLYIKALDLDKTHWKSWNNLGVCYATLRNLSEAIDSFHEATKFNRSSEVIYYNIALAYLNFEKYQEAVLCIKSAKLILKAASQEFEKLEKHVLAFEQERQRSLLGSRIIRSASRGRIGVSPIPARSAIFHTRIEESSPRTSKKELLGFNQVNISEGNNALTSNKDIARSMNGKIIRLRDRVISDMKTLIRTEIPQPLKIDSKYLTQEELREVNIEFCKPTEERNYEKIDSICLKLGFFQKFQPHIREKIYRMCDIKFYNPGEAIFNQGEVGENMYVIIRGAVTIKKEGKEFGGQNIVVNSIYDGRQFGELALLNAMNPSKSSNERTASCIACEKSHLLCMPKVNYSEILLLSNKKDLDEKIEFFLSLPFFIGIQRSYLMALASNIEKISYKLNDVILDKGELPKGLYIISKGHAILYTEGYSVKEKYTGEYSRLRTQRPKPAPIYHSLSPPGKKKKQAENEFETSPLKRIATREMNEMSEEKMKTIQKFLTQEEIATVNDENHLIKERIPFTSLKEKDFFGGRAVLDGYFGSNKQNTPSKFCIAAQSTTVELYLLTKYHLQFLTQEMTTQLATILEKSYETDCPSEIDPKQMDNLFRSWQSFKVQLIKDIRKENYIAKHKALFPYKN